MKDQKPSDPSQELTELEPLDPQELPELQELEELPELPEMEDLPELPDLPGESANAPAPPAPKAKGAPQPKPAPKAPAPAPKPVAKAPEPKPAPQAPEPEPEPKAPEPAAPEASLEPEPAAPADLVEEAVPATAGADAPAAANLAPGEKPPLRELDKAPGHLRTAATIVIVGSLLPWTGHGGGVLTSAVGKVLVLVAAWLWWRQVDHNWGPKLSGFLGKLGELELRPSKKPDPDQKPRRARPGAEQRPSTLTHPFPTGLHALSLIVMLIGAVGMPFSEGLAGMALGAAVAELGMLAWAAYTWVHIHAYERWGPFNPIFPLMFLAMLIGGLARAGGGLMGAGEVEGMVKTAMILGGAIVAVGGGFAAYTMVEALAQAKKEGDAKKAAALEARRAARRSKS